MYTSKLILDECNNFRHGVKFYISHINESLPMVIELDGYNIDYNRPNELSEILKCNKIIVEHRYFGES